MDINDNEIPIENEAQVSIEESKSLNELQDKPLDIEQDQQNLTSQDSYGIAQLLKVVVLFLQEIVANITQPEIDKIENSIEELKNKTHDEKIEKIQNNHFSSTFKDKFISSYIKEYENKVVERNGAKLSFSEILALKVPQAEQYIVSSVNFMKNKLEDSSINKEDNNISDKNNLKHKPKKDDDEKYDEDDDFEDNDYDIDNNSNGFRNFLRMETLKC